VVLGCHQVIDIYNRHRTGFWLNGTHAQLHKPANCEQKPIETSILYITLISNAHMENKDMQPLLLIARQISQRTCQ
jgi:hypothetical protein